MGIEKWLSIIYKSILSYYLQLPVEESTDRTTETYQTYTPDRASGFSDSIQAKKKGLGKSKLQTEY